MAEKQSNRAAKSKARKRADNIAVKSDQRSAQINKRMAAGDIVNLDPRVFARVYITAGLSER